MHPLRILPFVFLCGMALAQNYTAHPLDNLTSNTSQATPFGSDPSNNDEVRTQFLFPAAFVPTTGGVVTALEVVPELIGPIPYERLEIWMDHTTNAALSSTFAANLTSPTLVFSRSPGTIPWVRGTWNPIPFDRPFVYDGTRNLVLEVRKKLDRPNNPTISSCTHRVLVYPRRVDLPRPIWAFGPYASGAVDAATATSTYSTLFHMRLQWGTARSLTIDSTRDTTGNLSRSYFHLGATATLTTQGTPGETFFDLLDAALSPAGIPIGPILGEYWLRGSFLFAIGTLDGAGRGTASLTIPNDASLIGVRVFFQSLTLGTSFHWTNVVDGPIAVY